MQIVSATEAKNHLSAVMNLAIAEPLIIEKNGRPFVVMMSAEAYEQQEEERRKLSFLALCDDLAATAMENGMTKEILQSLLADDAPRH
jgi:prevent-host-death family protein